ncbi:MAG: hypothetical protein E7Z92_04525 [Cyanobacteria bacterium SIG31]|nr:hypothetical protein [Cyanobacteria bacterium SIG31]
MNNIGANINNNDWLKQKQPSFKNIPATQISAENIVPEVQIPDIYTNSMPTEAPKTLVEKVKQVDMFGAVYPWLETPLLMGGTCLALSKGLDAYTHACGGEYEKSVLGKITKFGDNIQNSKFVQSTPVQKVLGWFDSGITNTKKLLNKSSLYRSVTDRNMWTRPEKATGKSEMITQEVRIIEDFNRITEKLRLNSDGVPALKDLGLDRAEKAFIKDLKTSLGNSYMEDIASQAIQLRRLNITEESQIIEIISKGETKNKILEALGLTADDVAKIRLNPEESVQKVRDAVRKVGNKVRIGEGHYNLLGPIQPLERTISCDQVGNRLTSIIDGAKTKTGKFFAKFIQKVHRGFTFGGGKLGMCLFIAPSFVMMMKNLKKADSDQKVGTVANGVIEAISWAFTFPLAIASTYAIGGMKHAGMTPEKVKMLHDRTAAFNKKVAEGAFADKAAYDKAYKRLMLERKALTRVKKQNLFAKTMRKIANFFYCDLNTVKSYKGSNFIMNKIRQIPNFFRHLGCEPVRFILAMFVIESFLRNIVIKGSKAIFGNHYDHYKEEEYETKKKEQKKFTQQDLQQRLYTAQARKMMPAQATQKNNSQQVNVPASVFPTVEQENNLPEQDKTATKEIVETQKVTPEENKEVNVPKVEQVQEQKEEKYIPNEEQFIAQAPKTEKRDNYTYIPSSESAFTKQNKEKEEFKVNKYIPAQTAANFVKTFDNSGLDGALRRAERAEQRAIQILAGHFNGV